MNYKFIYKTPDGFSDILIQSDGEYLTGLNFISDEDEFADTEQYAGSIPGVIERTANWLDLYFSGNIPVPFPEYRLDRVSEFTCRVLAIAESVPYGQTVTYKHIAARIAKEKGIKNMSAQAVGRALGRNPICIIIPCHRILGTGGKLTGYSGGAENKRLLLELEACRVIK